VVSVFTAATPRHPRLGSESPRKHEDTKQKQVVFFVISWFRGWSSPSGMPNIRGLSAVYPAVTSLRGLQPASAWQAGETLVAIPADACPQDAAERLGLLFDLHHQRLYRLARRLSRTPEDARDLVQETFLRAAQAVRTIPAGAPHEEAWLVRVLINICRDGWRRAAVRKRLEPIRAMDDMTQSDYLEAAIVARTTVHRALDRLPPRRRAAIVLYELEGATIPAIAKLLGVAAVTVRWHLSRGRKDLARIIGQEGLEGRDGGREGRERVEGQEGTS